MGSARFPHGNTTVKLQHWGNISLTELKGETDRAAVPLRLKLNINQRRGRVLHLRIMAEAKFWIMPRTGMALESVDSTATGVTATKGFDLARDLIGGLPELEDQIGAERSAPSGQARAEWVPTAVRDLQSFDVQFKDNRDPHAAAPARVGAGTIFSRRIINERPDNAAPWRVEIEYASGDTVIFNVQFRNRKTIPAGLSLLFQPSGHVAYAP